MGPQIATEAPKLSETATTTIGETVEDDKYTADGARARELYKYFQPPKPSNFICASQSAAPNTVLTAHVQLVAWRLNAQRALVSLIDRDTQYFVAESTKTLNLANSEEHEHPDDAIWAGCISVPKAGRLCEHTIQEMPTSDGRPACFEVLDLTEDERFNTLPFVTGHPYFKYYVGVPLRTKKGIAIGSLFAMDDKVREPLSESGKDFLTTMASNIMEHLELMKEKEDRRRAVNMNMCLAAFVDPEHQLRRLKHSNSYSTDRGPRKHATFAEHKAARSGKDEKQTTPITSPKLVAAVPKSPPPPSTVPDSPNRSSGRRSTKSQGRRTISRNNDSNTSDSDSEIGGESRVGENARVETFQRAATLLQESLALERGGGIVFMNTTTGSPSPTVRHSTPLERPPGDSTTSKHQELPADITDQALNKPTYSASSHPPIFAEAGQFAEVLAHSESPADPDEEPSTQPSFIPLPPSELARLIRRHPRGKLYSFDDNGLNLGGSSGEELWQNEYYGSINHKRNRTSKTESAILMKAFPGARQVIFLPLWDVTSSRWAACFAYNNCDYRTFSHNPDFLHSIAFCNCLMTEISRLATIAADQQKSDFIGSISHELRSPLHGILASCEFLEDTECTSYQKSLVSTADGCARTLLDTINMVLDYSKINTFERNIRKARRARKDISTTATAVPLLQQPSLNIYDTIDLAAVTEEVVEGVAIGHIFKDIATFSSDSPRVDEPYPLERRRSSISTVRAVRPDVEVLIDIPPRRWNFITQPGAFRRVVMNLFGNALKYTKAGHIKVKLEASDVVDLTLSKSETQDVPTSSIVTLTISDTGQGISPEYLKTKLFTPFAQESPLNPGTGLGLSLVRSIVDMLNGDINIKSALGVGTEVVVRLPVVKGSPTGSSASSSSTPASAPTSAASGIERPLDNTIAVVRQLAPDLTAALFRPMNLDDIADHKILSLECAKTMATNYFRQWYGFAQILEWSPLHNPDITPAVILVDEVDLPDLLEFCPTAGSTSPRSPMLVVIRANSAKNPTTDFLLKTGHTQFLSRPCGPYKLARGLRNLLEHRVKCVAGKGHNAKSAPTAEEATADDVAMHVEQITLETKDPDSPTLNILQQGEVLGKQDSMAAQMAMDALPPAEAANPIEQKEEFPFPESSPSDDGITSPSFVQNRPPLEHSRTMSWTPREILANEQPPASPMSTIGVVVSSPISPIKASSDKSASTPIQEAVRPPRLLLVDDNKVNLRLLQTFMKKRAYTDVSSAEDGAQAVSVFTSLILQDPPQPPDIIFMDISMPIMNGFEATRKIREIEAQRRDTLPPMQRPAPSLIVALTGLASGRDQSEAFTSGFDLYMTKPVSFREVGRLLDNWEANGGTAADQVPHGPVTGRVE